MGNRMQGGQRRREVSVERGSLGAIAGPASTRMASSARTPEAMPTAGLRKKEAKYVREKGTYAYKISSNTYPRIQNAAEHIHPEVDNDKEGTGKQNNTLDQG